MAGLWLILAAISALAWLWLLLFRGQFWRCDQHLEPSEFSASESTNESKTWPSVCAIVPARNEADVLPQTLPTLLQQDYPGPFQIILVDDRSEDGTGEVARSLDSNGRLKVIQTEPLPSGWTGKLWAMHQGVAQAQAEFLLFTDADIAHSPQSLRTLVSKAQKEKLDLVSLMVLLRVQTFWERLLIPAFVFFFQKLYPFRWANNPARATAAAAGGCVLLRCQSLMQAGGLQTISGALIDDCALAALIKRSGGRVWLGLTRDVLSLRPYDTLSEIWNMVARTAFTQLDYSPWLLTGTVLGMVLLYLIPVLTLGSWLLMSLAYWPTVRLYGSSPWWAFTLPLAGLLYTAMTIDSALRHWSGRGGAWKGRTYSLTEAAPGTDT
ncbi:glycosyltransferase [Leptolyngbya sp. FACHB-261]|uniref:glycosyltransferase n=1 Tax=Leptolyngbya sp. FACHB-261 TaxID=2692806 RepID=UPI00168814FD|nr:glycosyltransferase [Leptolyngbya sp. FACHB-261]MBD2104901.1 glycosyltransferase [Leptolyngbya sp. FACHB-261]